MFALDQEKSYSAQIAVTIFREFNMHLEELFGTYENNIWHEYDDVYIHTLTVYSELIKAIHFGFITNPQQKDQLHQYLFTEIDNTGFFNLHALFIATLFHDFAKPETIQCDQTSNQTCCPDHEIKGAEKFKLLFRRKHERLPKSVRTRIYTIIQFHTIPHGVFVPKEKQEVERSIEEFLQSHKAIAIELALLGYADTKGCQLYKLNPTEYQTRMELYESFFNSLDVTQTR